MASEASPEGSLHHGCPLGDGQDMVAENADEEKLPRYLNLPFIRAHRRPSAVQSLWHPICSLVSFVFFAALSEAGGS